MEIARANKKERGFKIKKKQLSSSNGALPKNTKILLYKTILKTVPTNPRCGTQHLTPPST